MKLKQTSLVILNRFWQLLATFVILLAVLVTIIRYSMPYVNNYRETLESYITETSGIKINIGQLKGRWESMGPVLELDDISFGSETNQQHIVKSVTIKTKILPSLFYRTLITDGLSIEGLSLELKQQPSGKFILPNISYYSDQPSGEHKLPAIIQNWLQHQSHLLLMDTKINILIKNGVKYPIKLDVINFIKGKDIYQLLGYSDLPGDNQIVFGFETDGFLTDPSTRGQLFIGANQIDMIALPLNAVWDKTAIDSGELDMKLWADWIGGSFDSALISLDINNFQLSLMEEPQINIEKLTTNLVWKHLSDGWAFESQQANIISQGRIWPDPLLFIRMKEDGNQQNYQFSASTLNLGIWADLLLTNSTLNSQLREQLLAMDIKGYLNDARISAVVENFQLEEINGSAFFSEITWLPWKKIPGVKNLAGQFEFNKDSGRLQLDSRHAKLDYPAMFRWPFNLDNINGRFSWNITEDNLTLEINNFLLDLSETQLLADGLFDIHRNSNVVDINLYGELTNGDIAKTKFFLPTGIMKDSLTQYLDQSIQSGTLESTQISMRGASSGFPFVDNEGVFAINAKAKNASYKFLKEWPDITNIDADLWFVGNSMDIRVMDAKSNAQNISHATVAIADFSANPSILTVKSSSAGVIEDGIDYIDNSPLKDSVGKVFDVIPAEGSFELTLDLLIPLVTDSDLKVDGQINLLGNSLTVVPVEMAIENIKGQISIIDSRLFSKQITADVMGGQSSFSLKQQLDKQDVLITRVLGEGIISTTGVRTVFPDWLPNMIQGNTQYDVRLLLPQVVQNKSSSDLLVDINFTSNLQGIDSYFPQPFDKKAQQEESFIFSYKLLNNEQQLYSGTLSDRADMKLHIQNQEDASGRIIFGGKKAAISSHKGVELTGNFKSFDLKPWLELLQRPEISIKDYNFNNLHNIRINNLIVDDLKYYSMNFSQVSVSAKQFANTMSFSLDGKTIAGNISIPGPDLTKPIAIDLSHLIIQDQFPTSDKTEDNSEKSQIQSNANPLPAMNIHCEKCIYNEQPFGSAWINISPLAKGNAFKVKTSGEKVLELNIEGEWQANSDEEVITRLSGNLNTHHPGILLNIFNLQTGIRETELKTKGEINWLGDPLQFNLETLSGNLNIDAGKGSQKDISDKGARIFSLLSVESVFRRLSLDFSDLFGDGFFFDKMEGDFIINKGVLHTNDFEIAGTSADVEIKGFTDFPNDRIETCIRVTPKLSSSLPVLAGWAIEPVTGLVVYLMSKLFQPVLKVVTSILYKVEGPLDAPEIIEVRKTSGTAVIDNSVEQGKTTITPDTNVSDFNCNKAFVE